MSCSPHSLLISTDSTFNKHELICFIIIFKILPQFALALTFC